MADREDAVAHFFGGRTDTTPSPATDEPELEDTATEGEIAVDVYQTDSDVVIVSPIAGVDPEAIELSATDDTVTISGERQGEHVRQKEQLVTQEIFWGAFSRTVELPAACETDKAAASFKHGVLTVKIPKSGKDKKHSIKIKNDE